MAQKTMANTAPGNAVRIGHCRAKPNREHGSVVAREPPTGKISTTAIKKSRVLESQRGTPVAATAGVFLFFSRKVQTRYLSWAPLRSIR